MNFEILETKRLWLKGISPSEMNSIFERCTKEEIMSILGHRSEEEYQIEENKYKNGYSSYNRSFIVFLLIDKGTERIIGRCGIHNWNKEHRRAEIGYVMNNEDFRRKGLMNEALSKILSYGFHKLELHRMEALVGEGNVASLRLMEIHNFAREGVLREHYYKDGKYEDSILFSRLRSEYMQTNSI